MRLQDLINQNRGVIDGFINASVYRFDGNGGFGQVPYPPPIYNDKERAAWISSDESLYNWALAMGWPG